MSPATGPTVPTEPATRRVSDTPPRADDGKRASRRLLGAAERLLARVDALLTTIACASILFIMAIVGTDVLLRYLFNHPIVWAYDVISLYLVGTVFFFSLSDTFATNGHVRIDLFVERFGPRTRRRLERLWSVLSAAAFALVGWLWLIRTWTAWDASEVVAGIVNWPVWISTLVVPLGTFALLARLLLRALDGRPAPAPSSVPVVD